MVIIKHQVLVVGLILLITGITIFSNKTKLKDNQVECMAKVQYAYANIEDAYTIQERVTFYKIYVEYEINGKKYESSYPSEKPIAEGTTVKICYDKEHPKNIITDTDTTLSIVLLVIGGILVMLELINFFYKKWSNN